MSENKIKTKAFIPYLFSFILILAAYLVYTIVPSSELANSIEHSGMDAVYVLTAAPILSFSALVLSVLSYALNRKYLNELLSKQIAFAGCAVITFMLLLCTYFSISFVVSQYQLGFTAPINDTKWESYGIFMLVACIIQFISMILLALKMKGIIANNKK